MLFKTKVLNAFQQQLQLNIVCYQKSIDDISLSIANENKSTAGDKHETALAHLQIEQSNLAQQLTKAQEQKAMFDFTSKQASSNTIALGSLIKTTRGYFYVGLALPKITIDSIQVTGISVHSPLGKILVNKKIEDEVIFNGITHIIESIE